MQDETSPTETPIKLFRSIIQFYYSACVTAAANNSDSFIYPSPPPSKHLENIINNVPHVSVLLWFEVPLQFSCLRWGLWSRFWTGVDSLKKQATKKTKLVLNFFRKRKRILKENSQLSSYNEAPWMKLSLYTFEMGLDTRYRGYLTTSKQVNNQYNSRGWKCVCVWQHTTSSRGQQAEEALRWIQHDPPGPPGRALGRMKIFFSAEFMTTICQRPLHRGAGERISKSRHSDGGGGWVG